MFWSPLIENRKLKKPSVLRGLNMTCGRRVPISPSLRKRVLKFYGKRCILQDSQARGPGFKPRLHHIDEVNCNTIFENLAPLCSECNNAFEDEKARNEPPLLRHVTPQAIEARGMELYEEGDYPGSYGCYRIAAHLWESRRNIISGKLICLSRAIGAIRARWEPDSLKYTIGEAKKTFLSIRGDKNSYAECRAEFLAHMGLALTDHNCWEEAMDWEVAAFHLKNRLAKGQIRYGKHPAVHEQELANYKRRAAWVIQHDPKYSKKFRDRLQKALKDDLDLFLKYGNVRGWATNRDVIAQMEVARLGEWTSTVRDIAEETLEKEDKFRNVWVQTSHHSHLGFSYLADYEKARNARSAKRARSKVIEELYRVCELANKYNLSLEPVRGRGIIRPDLELRKLGFNNAPEIPIRGVFPLTKRQLKALLKLVTEGLL